MTTPDPIPDILDQASGVAQTQWNQEIAQFASFMAVAQDIAGKQRYLYDLLTECGLPGRIVDESVIEFGKDEWHRAKQQGKKA